jgi:hypothetical protein
LYVITYVGIICCNTNKEYINFINRVLIMKISNWWKVFFMRFHQLSGTRNSYAALQTIIHAPNKAYNN